MRICPNCGSGNIIRYGKIHNGKRRSDCKYCGRQFVGNPENKIIPEYPEDIIDSLLLERISLAGIDRAAEVSETWLKEYVSKKYEETPIIVNMTHKKKERW